MVLPRYHSFSPAAMRKSSAGKSGKTAFHTRQPATPGSGYISRTFSVEALRMNRATRDG